MKVKAAVIFDQVLPRPYERVRQSRSNKLTYLAQMKLK